MKIYIIALLAMIMMSTYAFRFSSKMQSKAKTGLELDCGFYTRKYSLSSSSLPA